jgi:hypothetical protein
MTKKELIKLLEKFPDDATITRANEIPDWGKFSEKVEHIKYNKYYNAIIVD